MGNPINGPVSIDRKWLAQSCQLCQVILSGDYPVDTSFAARELFTQFNSILGGRWQDYLATGGGASAHAQSA